MFVRVLMARKKKLHHRLDTALNDFVGIKKTPTIAFIGKNFVYLAGVQNILCLFFSTADKQFHRINLKQVIFSLSSTMEVH